MALTTQQKLDEARAAYHSLMTGTQSVEIDDGDWRAKYTRANASDLAMYIRMLESQLADEQGVVPDPNVRRLVRYYNGYGSC